MASINLADYAKLVAAKDDPLKLGVIQAFRENSKVMDMLTFTDTGDLSIKFTRAKSLPAPGFRKVGADYSSSKGDFRPMEDRIFLLGQYIDIDKAIERATGSVNNPRSVHQQMALEAMARTFNYYFINGDPETDEDGLVGLHYRTLNDLPSSQMVAGGGLDISPDTGTSTWYTDVIDKLEALIDACNEGEVDALLMDRTTKLRLEAAFRKSGLLSTTKDQLGRKFTTYGDGGPMLVPMGYHRDDTDTAAGTRVIAHTEADDGSALTGGDATSIYAVKFGKDHLGGAQEYPMEVEDIGLLDDGVTYRTVIDWPVGIYLVRPRSVARLHGIVAA